MTPDAFRQLALSFSGVREQTNLGVQEFRLKERAFVTLGAPDAGWAIVKLPVPQQVQLLARSTALSPEPGGRGARGTTRVKLSNLTEEVATLLLRAAWRHASAG